MFRYIGFSWDAANDAQAGLAARIDQALFAGEGWQAALRLSTLRVYTVGHSKGINGVYRLPGEQGVIVGRLFRRAAEAPAPLQDIELTEAEADCIVHTDGQSLTESFWGRYVAFLPSWTGETRVLRDPTGTLPCFRIEIEGVAIFFSWLEDLFDLLPRFAAPAVNWDAVAAHILLGRLGGRETALAGVTQLLPGELTPARTGAGRPLTLWSAVDQASCPVELEPGAAATQLRSTVRECVQSWASCYDVTLLRLSGGVDSAILLTALCPDVPPARVVCLNYHSPGSDGDERAFARLAAGHAGTALIERARDPRFNLEEVLAAARLPTPGSYVGRMGTGRMDADAAMEHGAGAMFTGAGGDQLFFELRCAWPAADYLKLRGIDRGFLAAALDAARLGHVSFWQALRQAFASRSFRANLAADAGSYVTLTPREALEPHLRQSERFVHPALLVPTELPIGKFHQVEALLYPFEYYDPFMRDAAPELVNPLLSQPLIELCLQTPTYLLTLGGRGRALARRAFAGDLPPSIASRRSKGGMEEHVAEVLQRNLLFARDLLLDGHLARQGLLDRRRVEAALSGRLSAVDAYVSEIHNCIALEGWLQRIVASGG